MDAFLLGHGVYTTKVLSTPRAPVCPLSFYILY